MNDVAKIVKAALNEYVAPNRSRLYSFGQLIDLLSSPANVSMFDITAIERSKLKKFLNSLFAQILKTNIVISKDRKLYDKTELSKNNIKILLNVLIIFIMI